MTKLALARFGVVGPVFTSPKCASASLVNVRVVWFLQHLNVRVLVWPMCEWSGFYNTGMCECLFGQCASSPVIKCEFGDVPMNGYVQVEMCEWSGHNMRVNMECASRVMCE